MALDADTIVDRRRMRRKLTFWRVFAVLLAIGAVVASEPRCTRPAPDAERRGGSVDRTRHHHRPHPQRSRSGRGLRAARPLASEGRDRAYQQPRRHHLGVRRTARFAEAAESEKPTVVVVDGLAASGGYIAAIAADHIVAMDTSLVGSIGVLFQFPNFGDLLKTLGIKIEEIKSSPLKAAPNGFEPTSPGGARRHRGDRQGFLCLVPRPREDPPGSTRLSSTASPMAASSPAARACRSSSSTSSATSARRSPGSPRKGNRPEDSGARLPAARPAERPAIPAHGRSGRARSGRPLALGAAVRGMGRRAGNRPAQS